MTRFGLVLLTFGYAAIAVPARSEEVDGARLYREKIAPLFAERCASCHSTGAEKVKGGLLLDNRAAVLRGGDGGPAVTPGKPEESPLLQAIRHEAGLRMPPRGPKLADDRIKDVETWIKSGAPMPGADAPVESVFESARTHWAFQPVRETPPPRVRDAASVLTPIDAYIVERLERAGRRLSPPADRTTWLRRVTFDLTGLPPTPEEIDAFVADASRDAYERVVDRLLASPRYGEKWALHWLDLIRYAESEGFEYDRHLPDAWRFRDYVVASLNADKPFDRFVTEQIAGDEIGPKSDECLTASAFHRLGAVRRNAGDSDVAFSRNEVLTERTDIIGSAFLGLTIGCARCHNHKLEPILQKDYYRLQAYLAATDENNIVQASPAEKSAWEAKVQAIKDEMKRLKDESRKVTGDAKAKLLQKIEELEDSIPTTPATIPATRNDFDKRTKIHVLKRGAWENKGEPVGPRPPSILVADSEGERPADLRAPRTELARWLVSAENPLTARVFVNRVWHHHFGIGLVKTVNDFGVKGDRPSHPELLDRLAARFVAGGWKLKPLHREIVLSAAYRQASSTAIPASDPENRLLGSFPRRRLEAEEIRDAMLAASGRLNDRAGGPSVMLPVDKELVNLLYKPIQWRVTPDHREHDRRSLYLFAKRNLRLPFMETFDAPPLMTACGRRESSTHPPQALELLNGALSNDLASSFADRLRRECGDDPERIVDRAFRLAVGRPPISREREAALAFLKDQPVREFALALFNLNGFLYVF